jgi:hypothetical protein
MQILANIFPSHLRREYNIFLLSTRPHSPLKADWGRKQNRRQLLWNPSAGRFNDDTKVCFVFYVPYIFFGSQYPSITSESHYWTRRVLHEVYRITTLYKSSSGHKRKTFDKFRTGRGRAGTVFNSATGSELVFVKTRDTLDKCHLTKTDNAD